MVRRLVTIPLVAFVAGGVIVRLMDQAPRPSLSRPLPAALPESSIDLPATPAPAETVVPAWVAPKPRIADELRYLAELRFHEDVILAYARGQGFRPSPEEVSSLKAAGLSDGFLGRLTGTSEAPRVEPVVVVQPPPIQVSTTVYAPVEVTVIEAPQAPVPEPAIHTVVLCAPHAPPAFTRPAVYQEPPFFKTHEFMPTKRLPTAEEVAQREAARRHR